MRTILNRTVLSHSVASVLLSSDPSLVDSMSLWSGPILVLWLYLPGYLANTAAMLGGKWIPDLTGFKPRPIDGGRRLSDGHRILGDGKTWNGLIGAIVGAGLVGSLLSIYFAKMGAKVSVFERRNDIRKDIFSKCIRKCFTISYYSFD